jgi:hypothetical protein
MLTRLGAELVAELAPEGDCSQRRFQPGFTRHGDFRQYCDIHPAAILALRFRLHSIDNRAQFRQSLGQPRMLNPKWLHNSAHDDLAGRA